jgi:hypothetical protein
MSALNSQDLSEKSPIETTGARIESYTSDSEARDIEKGGPSDFKPDDKFSPYRIFSGRPDINRIMAASVATVANESPDDRVIVGVCGPIAMTSSTREAVSKIEREDILSITQYTEVSVHEAMFSRE